MANHGRRWVVVALAALTVAVVACGNAAERDLCREYEDLQASVAQLDELDPATATASDALALVEEVIVQLEQLQAASDGLYDQIVSNLNLALLDLRQVTFDLGDEGLEVARPLMEESVATSVTAYEQLQQRLDVVCGTG